MRILYTRPDGGLSVVIPTGEVPFEVVLKKDVPADATNVTVCEADEIPGDRTFRDAWELSPEKKCRVNIGKARDIQRQRLREQRAPKLAELDVAFMRALERGEPTGAIVAEKQRLRDATSDPRIEAAQTLDELKAVTL